MTNEQLPSNNNDDSLNQEIEHGNLMYESRMKELIRNVAEHDGFGEVRIGKKGTTALQNALRFITVMFAYELVDSLRSQKMITVRAKSVNDALTKLVGRADSFSVTIEELEGLISKLQLKSNNTSITKAMDFVNLIDAHYNAESLIVDDSEDIESNVDEEIDD